MRPAMNYEEWLASIQPGDMVHVGDRDAKTVYFWHVSDVEDGFAYVNEFEFDLANGFGPPGKLLYPTDRVIERFQNQGLAEKIAAMCQQGDLTHLGRDALLDIHDRIMKEYEHVNYWPAGLRERESRYAGKSKDRRRGSDR